MNFFKVIQVWAGSKQRLGTKLFFLQAECHSCNLPKQTQTTDSDQRKPPTGLILPKQHSLEQLLNFYSIIINDKKINATPDLVTIALPIPGHNVQTWRRP